MGEWYDSTGIPTIPTIWASCVFDVNQSYRDRLSVVRRRHTPHGMQPLEFNVSEHRPVVIDLGAPSAVSKLLVGWSPFPTPGQRNRRRIVQ
jgi:hypothetical protein